ncbi:MAG: GvpL/GvpF family gas vesicle protein [Candidatus Contendobacter sp.]|nr:GvpL/GvpF family gas vesicle protein [Candidatus Contendobacter sp.]
MSYLLYCIAATAPDPALPLPLEGVAGGRVQWHDYGELSAAASELVRPPPADDVAQLLRYSQVIATLYQARTVIPLRYGCAFAREPQIGDWLARRRIHYKTLLAHLDGCNEMSLRLRLLSEPPQAESSPLAARLPGHAYLAGLQRLHERREQRRRWLDAEGRRYRTAVGNLARDWRQEYGADDNVMALHGLIPHAAMAEFHVVCHAVTANDSIAVSLGGPWPPYNFVLDGE